MTPQKENLHDLYLMLGPHQNTLSLRRCNEGIAGFEAFAAKIAQRALEKGYFPDNWLFHYHFTDDQISRLPLAIERNENYFLSLLPKLKRQKITPTHILPLERACILHDRNQPLLATYEQVQTSMLRDFTTSGSNNAPEMLKARPSFNAYNAVSIDKGVLIFSTTPSGFRNLENFLQYMADHFFNSVGVLSTFSMSVHRIPAFNPEHNKLANSWPEDNQRINELSSDDVGEIFLDRSILQTGIECHSFDMQPTLENFKAFVTPTEHTGLTISPFNADLCNLLYICSNGITANTPFPGETLKYTPIPRMESIKELMQRPFVSESEIESWQLTAKGEAENLIEKHFPEYKDTLLNFAIKEQLRDLAVRIQTRKEYATKNDASPARERERLKVRL